jgi:hypothetical protein
METAVFVVLLAAVAVAALYSVVKLATASGTGRHVTAKERSGAVLTLVASFAAAVLLLYVLLSGSV